MKITMSKEAGDYLMTIARAFIKDDFGQGNHKCWQFDGGRDTRIHRELRSLNLIKLNGTMGAPYSLTDLGHQLIMQNRPDLAEAAEAASALEPAAATDKSATYQSTFISYGGPDAAFARKLNEALEVRGVVTFFFEDDAPPGAKLRRVMSNGVNEHDRVILICSNASLSRPGLLNELEETLAREARDGGAEYLIPIRLDDYVLKGWDPPGKPDLARAVRDRVVANFSNHDDHAAFDHALDRLIAVLKKT